MDYETEQIVSLYKTSPAKIFNKMKKGDNIYVDNEQLVQVEVILNFCRVIYCVRPGEATEKAVHQIIIL